MLGNTSTTLAIQFFFFFFLYVSELNINAGDACIPVPPISTAKFSTEINDSVKTREGQKHRSPFENVLSNERSGQYNRGE